MISLSRLLSNTPIPVISGFNFHQSTIGSILDMGENMYWSLLKIWSLSREELVPEETEETAKLSDFTVWQLLVFTSPQLKTRLIASVDLFLHTKIEFLPISNTIMIGENDSQILLDETFYMSMREICKSVMNIGSSEKEEQYKETAHMSEREKAIIRKMRMSAEKLNRIKNGDKDIENRLAKQIISLVAIGHYTFSQVYEMTMMQMIYLLKKYVDIQQYELYTTLSPYIDSKKNQAPKHWLDT